jgi:hypothetical protein
MRLLVHAEHDRDLGRDASVMCGVSPNARQFRLIADWLISVSAAIERIDHRVAFAGCSSSAFTITSSTSSSVIQCGFLGRGSSCSPSKPRLAKRPRHLPTVDPVQPRQASISVLDDPVPAN